MTPLVKICGMTSADNIACALTLSPDWLGLIFHRPSPRNALGLAPEEHARFSGKVKFAGVFVNRPVGEVLNTAERYGLAAVQLHGDESPEYCHELCDRGFEVWKAVGIRTEEDMTALRRYADCVDSFVFDRKSASRGGTGEKFDWKLLKCYTLPVPFLLGGGIGPEDAELIHTLSHPHLAGIDLNSRFEISPGIKNIELLNDFLKKIRQL